LPQAHPPATFRLQGLATLLTVYALRPPAGFVSHRRRSWDSPFGAFSSRKVSGTLPPDAPTCRSAYRCSRRGKRWAGPNRLRLLGFHPSESPWRSGKVLVRRTLDAPMGFCLPGLAIGNLPRAIRLGILSHALQTGGLLVRSAGAPECRSVSDLFHPVCRAETRGTDGTPS
jgi:hypothetical protein